METIRGKVSREITFDELTERLTKCNNVSIDLGAGDGRFVLRMAEQHKDTFFIGIDSCRENLRISSRTKLPNALFVIASAQALPCELNGLASHVSINFPWGSLIESLLNADACLLNGLWDVTRPCAAMEINLNADALASAGCDLESGADRIERVLNAAGWKTKSCTCLKANELRTFPTTWAKRLAFGRDPRAVRLCFQK
ncbi:MAG: 16S rRNA (adenine(1408)-N(1))-methyltransferase [Anaerolineales bacterium]|nr:16S rRNA (adenine(1408)-N(1))-methyltransferase [Anaerolineales bacterium]